MEVLGHVCCISTLSLTTVFKFVICILKCCISVPFMLLPCCIHISLYYKLRFQNSSVDSWGGRRTRTISLVSVVLEEAIECYHTAKTVVQSQKLKKWIYVLAETKMIYISEEGWCLSESRGESCLELHGCWGERRVGSTWDILG